MRILAIDTALNVVAAGIWDSGEDAIVASETLAIERGHDEHLLPLVQRVLAQIEGGLELIDRIAVTIGPGSFTGIRIDIAAARALGMVRKIPVIGVPSLAAFAAPFIGKGEASVAAMIDARHGRVYTHVFSPVGKTLVEPRVLPIINAVRLLGSGPVILTGNAAPMAAIEAWSSGLNAEVAGNTGSPDISYVARLGMLGDPSAAPPTPLYLNAVNAKPAARSGLAPAPIAAAVPE